MKCFWYGCENEAENRVTKLFVLQGSVDLKDTINILLCVEHNIRSQSGDIGGMLPSNDSIKYIRVLEAEIGSSIGDACIKALESNDKRKQKSLSKKYMKALARSAPSKRLKTIHRRLKKIE